MVILWKFGIWWNLKSLNPKISKFEILNPNTKISNLDTKFLNFDDFCYKFEENFAEIDKIGDISKFEILNPKIQNLKSLTLKSKISNFDKIWQKIKIPPRWFIITLRFHQNSKVKILKNLSQYAGNNRWHKTFFKILKSIWTKIPKSAKMAQITKILKKILKTTLLLPHFSRWFSRLHFSFPWRSDAEKRLAALAAPRLSNFLRGRGILHGRWKSPAFHLNVQIFK